MTTPYDSTNDTLAHIALVAQKLERVVQALRARGSVHDASKLVSPEKEMFDCFRPKLDTMSIESDEYKQALVEMGEALQHHYEHNSHHPEHFPDGVNGMNLIDVVEMVCDWAAAAQRKGEVVNLDWARSRFGLAPQTESIIANTLLWLEA